MRRLLLVGLALAVASGCGAEIDVAVKKGRDALDRFLGEWDVRRAEIQRSIDAMKDGIDGIEKAKLLAEAKKKIANEDIELSKHRIERIDGALAKIRPALDVKGTSVIGEVSYTPEKVREMADVLLGERATVTSRTDELRGLVAMFDDAISADESNANEWRAQLRALGAKIREIDAKMDSARALREASTGIGGSSMASTNLAELEAKVNDFDAEVRAGLELQKKKLEQRRAKTDFGGADVLLGKIEGSASRTGEIDKILHNAN